MAKATKGSLEDQGVIEKNADHFPKGHSVF
jgi:hypothetical protein